MKKLLCLAVFALGYSSLSAQADSYTIATKDGSTCSQQESKSDKSFSFGTDFDTQKQEGTLTARFTIELGGNKVRKVDCNRLYNISVQREQLALDKALLEIELMKAQIEAIKSGKTLEQVDTIGANDW